MSDDFYARQCALAKVRSLCRVHADVIAEMVAKMLDEVPAELQLRVASMVEGDVASMKGVIQMREDKTKKGGRHE